MRLGVGTCIPATAAAALLFLLGACGPAVEPGNVAANSPPPPPAIAVPANQAEIPNDAAAAPEAAVEVPEDAPGLADMSPSRRRAYEQGYRDCSAGRYDPDPWPEAYRIGCGAAQEREAGGGAR